LPGLCAPAHAISPRRPTRLHSHPCWPPGKPSVRTLAGGLARRRGTAVGARSGNPCPGRQTSASARTSESCSHGAFPPTGNSFGKRAISLIAVRIRMGYIFAGIIPTEYRAVARAPLDMGATMTSIDRRTSGVANRRLRSRGGRRRTDRVADTAAQVSCEYCSGGIARLFKVTTVPDGLLLTYRCDGCGGTNLAQRPSAATGITQTRGRGAQSDPMSKDPNEGPTNEQTSENFPSGHQE
jgi:hypothetical protein